MSWDIRVDPDLDARISVSLRDVEWQEALKVITRMANAEVVPMPDHLRVRDTCVRSYLTAATTADASARTVLQLVGAYLDCDVAFAPNLEDRREAPLPRNVFGDDALPPFEALDRVTAALGIAWKRVDRHLRVGPQEWVERLPPD